MPKSDLSSDNWGDGETSMLKACFHPGPRDGVPHILKSDFVFDDGEAVLTIPKSDLPSDGEEGLHILKSDLTSDGEGGVSPMKSDFPSDCEEAASSVPKSGDRESVTSVPKSSQGPMKIRN
jgi:hypothetical protein